ncbi:MAG: hypothetical protein AAFV93_20410 [Chloroflexota bacterium]
MSNKQIRTISRYLHIVVGVMMILFIYIPELANNMLYANIVQFVAIPVVSISGILMWQQARIMKLFRKRSA